MTSFNTAFANNFKKIWARRKYKVIFALCCLIAVFISLFSQGGMSFRMGIMSFSFSDASYTILGIFSSAILPLSAFMLMSDLIGHEISDATLKTELLRPISRGKLYLSKSLAAFAYCAALLFAAFLISVTILLIQGVRQQVGVLFLSYLMGLMPTLVCVSLSGFLASLTGNPTLGMLLSVLIYVALFAASAFSHVFMAVSFTGQLSWYKMILGSQIQWGKLGLSALMQVSYAVFFSALGQGIFSRRNL